MKNKKKFISEVMKKNVLILIPILYFCPAAFADKNEQIVRRECSLHDSTTTSNPDSPMNKYLKNKFGLDCINIEKMDGSKQEITVPVCMERQSCIEKIDDLEIDESGYSVENHELNAKTFVTRRIVKQCVLNGNIYSPFTVESKEVIRGTHYGYEKYNAQRSKEEAVKLAIQSLNSDINKFLNKSKICPDSIIKRERFKQEITVPVCMERQSCIEKIDDLEIDQSGYSVEIRELNAKTFVTRRIVKQCALNGKISSPFTVESKEVIRGTHYGYEKYNARRSKEEAVKLAIQSLNSDITELVQSSSICSSLELR